LSGCREDHPARTTLAPPPAIRQHYGRGDHDTVTSPLRNVWQAMR
jgi:hypothetical protein